MRRPGGRGEGWATDGTRTRDNLKHNQGLYQLSYGHRLRDREFRGLRLRFKSKDAAAGRSRNQERGVDGIAGNALYPSLQMP